MLSFILMIIGGTIGSQFGTIGLVAGAAIGFGLGGSDSQSQTGNAARRSNDECLNDFALFREHETMDISDFSSGDHNHSFFGGSFASDTNWINPATGLPMIGDGMGGFDVGGNAFGSSSDDSLSSSSFDDNFGSGGMSDDW